MLTQSHVESMTVLVGSSTQGFPLEEPLLQNQLEDWIMKREMKKLRNMKNY